MPTIARFYGIMIQMRPLNKEHNPPHIHAIYGDYQDELLTMWNTQKFETLPPLE